MKKLFELSLFWLSIFVCKIRNNSFVKDCKLNENSSQIKLFLFLSLIYFIIGCNKSWKKNDFSSSFENAVTLPLKDTMLVTYWRWWEENETIKVIETPIYKIFGVLDSFSFIGRTIIDTSEFKNFSFFVVGKIVKKGVSGLILRIEGNSPYDQVVNLYLYDSNTKSIGHELKLVEFVMSESYQLRMQSWLIPYNEANQATVVTRRYEETSHFEDAENENAENDISIHDSIFVKQIKNGNWIELPIKDSEKMLGVFKFQ